VTDWQLDFLERCCDQAEDVAMSEGAFAPGPALWLEKREVAHFDDERTLDVRLTRSVIRCRRADLHSDERVTLRSGGSEWLEVTIEAADDAEMGQRHRPRRHCRQPGYGTSRTPPFRSRASASSPVPLTASSRHSGTVCGREPPVGSRTLRLRRDTRCIGHGRSCPGVDGATHPGSAPTPSSATCPRSIAPSDGLPQPPPPPDVAPGQKAAQSGYVRGILADPNRLQRCDHRTRVGDEGFEPPTPCASCRCSSQLS
jgi:Luciferase